MSYLPHQCWPVWAASASSTWNNVAGQNTSTGQAEHITAAGLIHLHSSATCCAVVLDYAVPYPAVLWPAAGSSITAVSLLHDTGQLQKYGGSDGILTAMLHTSRACALTVQAWVFQNDSTSTAGHLRLPPGMGWLLHSCPSRLGWCCAAERCRQDVGQTPWPSAPRPCCVPCRC